MANKQIAWWQYILLFIPGTLWGSGFLLNEIALQTLPFVTITAMRVVFAVIAMVLLLWAIGGGLPRWSREWWVFFVLGMTNNVIPFTLTVWAQQFLDSGLAAILTSTMPIFTIIFAHFFVAEERLTLWSFVGTVLGFVGIVVLVGPTALGELGVQLWAQLVLLLSASSYAFAAVYLRLQPPRQREESARGRLIALLQLTSAQYLCSFVLLVPAMFVFEQPWTLQPSAASIGALLALSILVTIAAAMIYFYMIEELGAGKASMTVYLIPIFALIWGALLLDETIAPNAIIALALILAGIGLVNYASGSEQRRESGQLEGGDVKDR